MKVNKIKISVVIPVYNVEPFIKQCLDSLINQTLKEIEIILVDDCSTDSSGEICDEYAAKDNRVVVIHNKKNIRQGLSRNKGIEIAKGEYIGFVDPDDWVDLDFFEKLYNTAKKNNSDIVKTEPIRVNSDGSQELNTSLNKTIRKGLKKRKPIFLLYTYEHTTAIFRKEIIINNRVRYPDIRNAQDLIFLLNATYFSETISLISGTNYFYRQHPNSIISIKEKPYFESTLQYFKLHLDFINAHKIEKNNYDLAFLRGFISVKNRYDEIGIMQGTDDFRRKYVKETLNIMSQYKYDTNYLLESFFKGFTYDKEIQQLKKGSAYRIGKTITWLPSKIKSLLK